MNAKAQKPNGNCSKRVRSKCAAHGVPYLRDEIQALSHVLWPLIFGLDLTLGF